MALNPNDVVLDQTSLDCAIEAAQEANVAGHDNQAQLVAAIRAYLASLFGDET